MLFEVRIYVAKVDGIGKFGDRKECRGLCECLKAFGILKS